MGVPRLPGLLHRFNLFITGCDLPAAVFVGKRVRFQHFGRGVVLHHKCYIEDDVMILPNVVIGQSLDAAGVRELRQIRIKAGAVIGAGAVIIAKGELSVGRRATVGALSLVTKDVVDFDTVVGNPARSIRRGACPRG